MSKAKKSAIILILAGAVISFLLTPVFWPFTTDPAHMPPESLMPFVFPLAILTSLTFGIGVAFLVLAYKPMRKLDKGFGLTFWSYVGTGWLLVSWWPHENLHRVSEGNWAALIWIEYGFHVTLYFVGMILAAYLARTWKEHRGA